MSRNLDAYRCREKALVAITADAEAEPQELQASGPSVEQPLEMDGRFSRHYPDFHQEVDDLFLAAVSSPRDYRFFVDEECGLGDEAGGWFLLG